MKRFYLFISSLEFEFYSANDKQLTNELKSILRKSESSASNIYGGIGQFWFSMDPIIFA